MKLNIEADEQNCCSDEDKYGPHESRLRVGAFFRPIKTLDLARPIICYMIYIPYANYKQQLMNRLGKLFGAL